MSLNENASGDATIAVKVRGAAKRASSIGLFDLSTSMGLVMVVGFVQNLVLARILGSEGFGHISIVNATMGFGQLFGAMGMTVAVLRHASAQEDNEKAWAVYRIGFPLILAASLAVSLLIVSITYSPLWVFDRLAGDWMPIMALGLPASVLFILNTKYLQSRERMREKAVLEFLNRAAVFLGAVIGTVLYGFEGFVYGSLAGLVAGMMNSVIRLQAIRPERRVASPVSRGELMNFGVWSVFTGVMGYVLTTADVFCISALTQDAQLTGIYGLAVVLQRVARIPAVAYADATFPSLVRSADSSTSFAATVRRMRRNMLLLAGGTSLAIALAAPVFVPLIFGVDYQPSVAPLLLLLIGQVAWASGAIHGRSLVAKGFVRANFSASAVAAAINIGANLTLIPKYGIIGAAIATVISQILWAVCVVSICRVAEPLLDASEV